MLCGTWFLFVSAVPFYLRDLRFCFGFQCDVSVKLAANLAHIEKRIANKWNKNYGAHKQKMCNTKCKVELTEWGMELVFVCYLLPLALIRCVSCEVVGMFCLCCMEINLQREVCIWMIIHLLLICFKKSFVYGSKLCASLRALSHFECTVCQATVHCCIFHSLHMTQNRNTFYWWRHRQLTTTKLHYFAFKT